ncbi:MAG: GIY-YIG nuclease family protein [Patescibacteria group bacterium]
MYWIYALKSTEKKFIYVGMTENLERRVNQHNAGRAPATQYYAPFTLLYSETAGSRQEARKREKYLKSGIGKEFLKNK